MRRPPHEGTTAQLGAAYPFIEGPPLPAELVVVGRDLAGGAFAYDPFELYRHGALTSPNLVVFGQVGRGKSAFVKTFCYRQFAYGRRLFVVDPKGEYGPLARATGGRILRLSPGGPVALNPLAAAGPGLAGPELSALAERVLASICEASLGRRLLVTERVALGEALGALRAERSVLTLRAVAQRLFAPRSAAISVPGCGPGELAELGRACGYALVRLLGGEFGAMFDGTGASVDLGADVVVLDVSSYYRSDALSVLMVALFGALLPAAAAARRPTIAVFDEAWALLENPYAGSFFQSAFKLARAYGLANVAVAHRPSDLVVPDPSQSHRAAGLLAESETAVCFALSAPEARRAGELLGLGRRARELLGALPRGTALWRVGNRLALVRHLLAPAEASIVDTDANMREG